MHGLIICAGTVRYGVRALTLEAVRRIGSSWCHNCSTLSIYDVQNITHIPNCYAPDLMHKNSFPANVRSALNLVAKSLGEL